MRYFVQRFLTVFVTLLAAGCGNDPPVGSGSDDAFIARLLAAPDSIVMPDGSTFHASVGYYLSIPFVHPWCGTGLDIEAERPGEWVDQRDYPWRASPYVSRFPHDWDMSIRVCNSWILCGERLLDHDSSPHVRFASGYGTGLSQSLASTDYVDGEDIVAVLELDGDCFEGPVLIRSSPRLLQQRVTMKNPTWDAIQLLPAERRRLLGYE